MEEENEKMRKVATDMKNKYYEEKKSWQAKLRAAAEASSTGLANTENVPPPALPRGDGGLEESESVWNAKLAALQALAEAKSEEAKELLIQNADLQLQLQQSGVLKARSGASSGSGTDAEALHAAQSEARGLRQRCGELEITIRRNAREQERLTKTVQNQVSEKKFWEHASVLLVLCVISCVVLYARARVMCAILTPPFSRTDAFGGRGFLVEDTAQVREGEG